MGLTNILRMPILLGRWCNTTLAKATATTIQSVTNSGLQQQRFKSTARDCKQLVPQCGDRFKQAPCDDKQRKIVLKQPAPEPLPPQKRSIKIKHAEICCGNPCYDSLPRFDTLYYKRSDKLNRQYQQTWAECPEMLKKPKLICCFDKIKYPKWQKRPRKLRPKTACKQVCASSTTKCPRLESPGCHKSRIPPKCLRFRSKSDCKKRKAPFPAYSECSRKLPKPLHPLECRCLLTPMMCEVWAHYHKMKRVKKIGLC